MEVLKYVAIIAAIGALGMVGDSLPKLGIPQEYALYIPAVQALLAALTMRLKQILGAREPQE